MDPLAAGTISLIVAYKYPVLFTVAVLGGAGFPVPSNTVIVACVYLASLGHLDHAAVAAIGLLGHFIGDCFAFWLVRSHGLTILRTVGLGWIPRSDTFRRLQRTIDAHPVATVFWTRFLGAITPVANVLAGLSNMTARTFVLTDLLGQTIQIGLLFVYGYAFGRNWPYVATAMGNANVALLCVIGGALLYLLRRRRGHAAPAESAVTAERTTPHSGGHGPDRPRTPR